MYKLRGATLYNVLCWLLFCGLLQVSAQVPGIAKPTDDRNEQNSISVQFLVGRIAVDGGSDVVPNATVILECNGSVRVRANVSKSGEFNLNPNARQADDGSPLPPGRTWQPERGGDNCILYGDAQGYTSDRLHIEDQNQPAGIVQVGTIMLHPVSSTGSNENSTVSVVSLAAPTKAKKAFEKGRKHLHKHDLQSACEDFQQAVQLYPKYAIAWLELGRVQLQEGKIPEAQKSFQRAAAEDTRLPGAYAELASLAAKRNDWALLVDSTDHLAQMSPNSPPAIWFLNSVAKFNIGRINEAELSAEKALSLDTRHTIPQLEYLYGLILARERNYERAIEHIRAYLRLAPKAIDAQRAQSNLSELEQRMASSDKSRTP